MIPQGRGHLSDAKTNSELTVMYLGDRSSSSDSEVEHSDKVWDCCPCVVKLGSRVDITLGEDNQSKKRCMIRNGKPGTCCLCFNEDVHEVQIFHNYLGLNLAIMRFFEGSPLCGLELFGQSSLPIDHRA